MTTDVGTTAAAGEFSVYWWDDSGRQYDELRNVDAETAVYRAKYLADGPASSLGIIDRIIITDGGDHCCFEWKKRGGVTFPPRPVEGVT